MFNISVCRWLYLNRGPLELEATALPTEPFLIILTFDILWVYFLDVIVFSVTICAKAYLDDVQPQFDCHHFFTHKNLSLEVNTDLFWPVPSFHSFQTVV